MKRERKGTTALPDARLRQPRGGKHRLRQMLGLFRGVLTG